MSCTIKFVFLSSKSGFAKILFMRSCENLGLKVGFLSLESKLWCIGQKSIQLSKVINKGLFGNVFQNSFFVFTK